jgi:hypothetical protein
MALVPAIFVTAVVAQRLLEQQKRWGTQIRVGSVLALIVIGVELGRHVLLWRVVDIESQVSFASERTEPQFALEAARTGYHGAVDLGLGITIVALIIWAYFVIRTAGWPLRVSALTKRIRS